MNTKFSIRHPIAVRDDEQIDKLNTVRNCYRLFVTNQRRKSASSHWLELSLLPKNVAILESLRFWLSHHLQSTWAQFKATSNKPLHRQLAGVNIRLLWSNAHFWVIFAFASVAKPNSARNLENQQKIGIAWQAHAVNNSDTIRFTSEIQNS